MIVILLNFSFLSFMLDSGLMRLVAKLLLKTEILLSTFGRVNRQRHIAKTKRCSYNMIMMITPENALN